MTATIPTGVGRLATGAFVILLTLAFFGIRSADAQVGGPHWVPESVTVFESDGEVTLTLSVSWQDRPARVKYETIAGSATAPSDYATVTGEVVFTEPGSIEIKIPIVDDDSSEGGESFTVYAWEEPPVDPWLWKSTATVRIAEEDGDQASEPSPPAGTRTTTPPGTGTPGRPATSGEPMDAESPATDGLASSPHAVPPTSGQGLELGVGETPRTGELEASSEVGLDRPPDATASAGGSATAWVLGCGAAVLSIGAMAWSQRSSDLRRERHEV